MSQIQLATIVRAANSASGLAGPKMAKSRTLLGLAPPSSSFSSRRLFTSKPAKEIAVLTTPNEMKAWSAAKRVAGLSLASTTLSSLPRIGLVPTMGALHSGHLQLASLAQSNSDHVVVSIFVNPLQFNSKADFNAYPRPIDDDIALCQKHGGIDAVYAPTAAAMYPQPLFQTHVEPGVLASRLEGEHRPGHFKGVTTVVTKLFNAVDPDIAIFGEKDFQQLAIIRRMVADLDMKVEILGMPTVREPSGLAMSSRNRRLSAEQKDKAVCISQGLLAAKNAHEQNNEWSAETLAGIVAKRIEQEPLAKLEYVEVVNVDTLERIHRIESGQKACILVAAWFGDVRLIDNMVVGGK